jgi:hypothetical protein
MVALASAFKGFFLTLVLLFAGLKTNEFITAVLFNWFLFRLFGGLEIFCEEELLEKVKRTSTLEKGEGVGGGGGEAGSGGRVGLVFGFDELLIMASSMGKITEGLSGTRG